MQQENETLRSKVNELNAEQAEKDKMIDEFTGVIDSRVDEWKVRRSLSHGQFFLEKQILETLDTFSRTY